MLRKLFFSLGAATLLSAAVCGNASAQRATCTARLNTASGAMAIDVVTVGSSKNQTNLSVTSLGPLSLIQSSATATTNACYDAAVLSGGILNVPDVAVGSDFYSVSLRSSNAATNQYSLDVVSKNQRVIPDAGIRANKASNPFATVDGNGVAYLGYEDRDLGGTRFQSSANGLSFANPTLLAYNNRSVDSRKTLMPDGVTWRLYQYDLNAKVMTSYSSANGNTFTPDTGTRYAPASGDNNTIGVYDSYVASDRSLILIYVGDLFGKNNLRMARSTDNGLTFAFYKSNVLGDDEAGGGGSSFIDNKTILLADGRRRMVTMRANEIHSFISSDGLSYTRENGVRLRPSDFAAAGVTIYSLNDPVMVRTKEGGYRMYVAASTSASTSEAQGNSNWVIVSALWAE